MEINKMLLFSKSFSVSISLSVSIENHPCYPNKYKNFLFIAIAIIDPIEHINTME